MLLAAGAADLGAATRLLDGANQNLRKALAKLDGSVQLPSTGNLKQSTIQQGELEK